MTTSSRNTMPPASRTKWRLAGEAIVCCNCAWGCPCQFNSLPTRGRCQGIGTWEIRSGHYGELQLGGLRFTGVYSWPGAVHEGNGTRILIVDESASPEQRRALVDLNDGHAGGGFFEVFAATCPDVREPIFAPIEFVADRERRVGTVRIPRVGEYQAEPIRNPVTGEEHRARIDLPNGFEYRQAEAANAASIRLDLPAPLGLALQNTHAHLNAFEWIGE